MTQNNKQTEKQPDCHDCHSIVINFIPFGILFLRTGKRTNLILLSVTVEQLQLYSVSLQQ